MVSCFSDCGFVRSPIHQALSDNARNARFEAVKVGDLARVPFEILLRRVAVQMRLGNMVERAENGALQEAEIALGRVRMPEVGAGVFVGAVVHSAVHGERRADLRIQRAFVRHEGAGLVRVGVDDWAQGLGGDRGDMERAGVAVALNEREHGLLRRGLAKRAVLGFAADIGFVGFDDFAFAAHRRKIGRSLQRFCECGGRETKPSCKACRSCG